MQLIEEIEQVPTTYLKKLVNTDDIWEIRAQQGNNIFRLLGFFDGGKLVVLTNGFQKKTQKTDPTPQPRTSQEMSKLTTY